MKPHAAASIILIVILSSSLTLISAFNPVAAAAPLNVYITADGAVQGTSNIQRNADTYTLTGNITGALYVEKDNIVIDGAGYTLVGGNRGVVLAQRRGVTVQNMRIELDGGYVVDVQDAQDCTLIGNSLIGTPKPIPDLPPGPVLGPIAINFLHSQNITVKDNTIRNFFYALSLEWSFGHTITGNLLVDGVLGIDITNTTGCVFRNNRMVNSSFSTRPYPLYQYQNDLDASNTIDGKPIYYWVNAYAQTVPSDASYIVLVNCSKILVQNCSPKGIALVSTTNSIISHVNMAGRGDGINLLGCSGINILDSTLRDGAIGIDLENSQNNTISRNEISGDITRGISLGYASYNVISANRFFNNSPAIAPSQDTVSVGNLIVSNNFTANGLAITVRGDMQIINNSFVGNGQAVLCYSGSSTITGNTLTGNNQGIILQSTGNVLRGNKFRDNTDSLPVNGANFAQDIDSTNTLNGKPIIYWVNQHNRTVPTDAGFVALVNCSSITAQNLTLSNQNQGLLLAFTANSNITGNLIFNNKNGIYLYGSPNNQFIGNNVTGNGCAVYISGGTIAFYGGPISYTPSSGNIFHHNNFVGNNQTLYDLAGAYQTDSSPSANIWDNGKAGNFWGNYTGVDANSDGIGDSFYIVYANNTDRYPLMTAQVVAVPEFPAWVLLPLLAVAAELAFAAKKKSPKVIV